MFVVVVVKAVVGMVVGVAVVVVVVVGSSGVGGWVCVCFFLADHGKIENFRGSSGGEGGCGGGEVVVGIVVVGRVKIN